jgi:xanthine/uracil/vitamin C permease (AzgA family)
VKAVVTATALSSTLASLLCGLTANLPVGMSPGMGLNAYLVFSQVRGTHSAAACRRNSRCSDCCKQHYVCHGTDDT